MQPDLKPRRSVFAHVAFAFALVFSVVACASEEDIEDDEAEFEEEDDENISSSASGITGPGSCAGRPIERAVRCATAKGARVLSFYRSPANQQQVRRENRCTNRCIGSAGCIRPTAGCTTSRHTTCGAVDFVNDGAPLSRAALRACGFAKTTAPHRNHYDFVN